MDYKTKMIDSSNIPNDENHYTSLSFNFKIIEDKMAISDSPLLVIAKPSLVKFISESGNFERNRYGYKKSNGKYNLYGEMIDVEILNISYSEMNGLHYAMVIDRDNEENFIVNRAL